MPIYMMNMIIMTTDNHDSVTIMDSTEINFYEVHKILGAERSINMIIKSDKLALRCSGTLYFSKMSKIGECGF